MKPGRGEPGPRHRAASSRPGDLPGPGRQALADRDRIDTGGNQVERGGSKSLCVSRVRFLVSVKSSPDVFQPGDQFPIDKGRGGAFVDPIGQSIDPIAGSGQGHRFHQLACPVESSPRRLPFGEVSLRIFDGLIVEQVGLSENQVDSAQPGLAFLNECNRRASTDDDERHDRAGKGERKAPAAALERGTGDGLVGQPIGEAAPLRFLVGPGLRASTAASSAARSFSLTPAR